MAKTVIDISEYNGSLDASKCKADGVILRIGFTGYVSGSPAFDKKFKEYYEALRKQNIPVGIYYFTLATNEVMVDMETDWILRQTKDLKLDYPIFVDVETQGNGTYGQKWMALDKNRRSALMDRWCNNIAKGGRRAGIYANRNWLNNYLAAEVTSKWDIWGAEYSDKLRWYGGAKMWQYTSKGDGNSFGLSKKEIDVSECYVDYPAIINGVTTYDNPFPVPTRTLYRRPFVVLSGDDVKWLQTELNYAGANLKVDGRCGDLTIGALKNYQSTHKDVNGKQLVVDGRCGFLTKGSLLANH